MKKYILLGGFYESDFEERINKLRKEGYDFHGPLVACSTIDGGIWYTREMVLKPGYETIPESEWI